jgi:hypothetical protein
MEKVINGDCGWRAYGVKLPFGAIAETLMSA